MYVLQPTTQDATTYDNPLRRKQMEIRQSYSKQVWSCKLRSRDEAKWYSHRQRTAKVAEYCCLPKELPTDWLCVAKGDNHLFYFLAFLSLHDSFEPHRDSWFRRCMRRKNRTRSWHDMPIGKQEYWQRSFKKNIYFLYLSDWNVTNFFWFWYQPALLVGF